MTVGRLAGKVAIVAGAGQTPGETMGNGRACALRFAAEGAQVICVDRDPERADSVATEIVQAGGTALGIGADLVREEACEAMVTDTVAAFGRIDILHNNVGIGTHDVGPSKMTEPIWDGILNVNLKPAMFATKHALPVMRRQQAGSILYISSVAAVCAVGLAAYKTSKAALNAYAHTVAMSNAPHGVRATRRSRHTAFAPHGVRATRRSRHTAFAPT